MPKIKENKKLENKQTKKHGLWFKIKQLFFGVGKEFQRISWPSLKHVLWSFLIVFVLTGFVVLVYFIVSDIMFASNIISQTQSAENATQSS